MSLNKRDIEKWIKFEFYFSGAKCKKILNILIEILMRTLESGDDVLISGFGKFCVKEKAERKSRDPTTGESIILPPRRVVTFKCSPNLREKIKRTHFLTSKGFDSFWIFDLIDFANQITPQNWIVREFLHNHEIKPGNLYINIIPFNKADWRIKNARAQVKQMEFLKISDVVNTWGSKNAVKALNKYGDGTFSRTEIEILIDDYDDLKGTMVHELAHIVAARLLAQKKHVWKLPYVIVLPIGEDTIPHGPVFQWAYKLLIKRVERIDDLVAEKCRNDLYNYQHPEITNQLMEVLREQTGTHQHSAI